MHTALLLAEKQRGPYGRICSKVRSHPFFAGIDFDQVLKREAFFCSALKLHHLFHVWRSCVEGSRATSAALVHILLHAALKRKGLFFQTIDTCRWPTGHSL